MINEHTDVKVSEINKAAIRIWFLCYFVLGIQGFLAVDFAKFLDTFVLYPGIAALTMFAYKYYSNEPLHSPDKEEWSRLLAYIYLLFPVSMMGFVALAFSLTGSYSKVYWIVTVSGTQIGFALACVLKWNSK